MSKFEDRLWSELIRSYGPQLALAAPPQRRRSHRAPRPLLAAALALVLAVIVGFLTLTAGTSAPPAYAVSRNGDGTIKVTIDELAGVSGANSKLAELGVSVKVLTVEQGCMSPARPIGITPTTYAQMTHPEGQAVTIQPSAIPAGDTLVLAAHALSGAVGLSVGLYHGAAPTCLPEGTSQAG
jgi:hypothetical protein